ncbi:fibroleukin-like [Saccostrea echinata]|uniref:fibroleukin-like n=1 Tax=Saccostrea echinata TaxID=191078 RepID=UPI002A8171D7|nr:fibroleukin-like [Saccostrea echinata]
MSNQCVLALIVFVSVSHATIISQNNYTRLEFDDKKSNNELLGEYNSQSSMECAAVCQMGCGVFGFNTLMKKCRTHKKIFTTEVSNEAGWRYYSNDFIPVDCKDLRENGLSKSGVYEIFPYSTITSPVRVYCDMETMDGGWTVIQKRVDGSLDFKRNWIDYKNGFGAPEWNVWIGNEVMHQLTKEKNSSLYVSITLEDVTRLYEMYDQFSVSNESEKYRLFLAGDAVGTLGDSMLKPSEQYATLSGMYFSTSDRDNDNSNDGKIGGNCAAAYGGGWWFNACHHAFLNGPWSPVHWTWPWCPTILSGSSIRETIMMIKRH